MKACGFTLMEVIAVLAIIALTFGIASYGVSRIIPAADAHTAAHRVARLDAWARGAALHEHRPAWLSFSGHSVLAVCDGETRRQELGDDVRINRVPPAAATPTTHGPVAIAPPGRSESYGVRISDGEKRVWLIVLGATGEALVIDNEREANDILGKLRRTRLIID
jgi:prepilin-type N-terminal cleavage/methylation domain-containing protein